jgi:heme O synthase-like polyprenyltransferase
LNEPAPLQLTEDRVPYRGIADAVEELVELFGGELGEGTDRSRKFTLPLRRGVAVSGAVECTVSWTVDDAVDGTVTLTCDRDIDAPKAQRVAMLVAGVIGAVLFMIWPFFPQRRELGTLAFMGGAIALAVYLLSLKRSSGGIAWDFLRRLVERQRGT